MPPPLAFLLLSGGELETRASAETQICGRDQRGSEDATVMRKVRALYTALTGTTVMFRAQQRYHHSTVWLYLCWARQSIQLKG